MFLRVLSLLLLALMVMASAQPTNSADAVVYNATDMHISSGLKRGKKRKCESGYIFFNNECRQIS